MINSRRKESKSNGQFYISHCYVRAHINFFN